MKVQLTISDTQLKLLFNGLNYTALYDKSVKRDDPEWVDLKRTIEQANDEINYGVARLASYKAVW